MSDVIKFDDLAGDITEVEDSSDARTDRLLVAFRNGYSISIIRGEHTYGGRNGLFEVGIMVNGKLTYDTPITSNVIGYLTEDDVLDVARKVRDLQGETMDENFHIHYAREEDD